MAQDIRCVECEALRRSEVRLMELNRSKEGQTCDCWKLSYRKVKDMNGPK